MWFSLLIILTIIGLTKTLGRHFQENRSAFIGIMVLSGLFSIGAMNIEGFASDINIKSMLLFAAFFGDCGDRSDSRRLAGGAGSVHPLYHRGGKMSVCSI